MKEIRKWFKTKDKLPEESVRVLMCDETGGMVTGYRGHLLTSPNIYIAWMYLPSKPKFIEN